MSCLMVTGDDCGMSGGITQTASAHHQAGMLQTASVVANYGASTRETIAQLRQIQTIEIGVHLNLVEGDALSQAARQSALTDPNGVFHHPYRVFWQMLNPSKRLRNAIQAELAAQIDVIVAAGIKPAHLTTHMHTHLLPSIYPMVMELAAEYDVRWVRNADPRCAVIPNNPLRGLASTAKQQGDFRQPDYLVSIYHWVDHPPQQLASVMLQLDGWIELVLHPSPAHDPTFPPDVRYPPVERVRESRYLTQLFEYLRPHLGEHLRIYQTRD